jgi:hypothetical protein
VTLGSVDSFILPLRILGLYGGKEVFSKEVLVRKIRFGNEGTGIYIINIPALVL